MINACTRLFRSALLCGMFCAALLATAFSGVPAAPCAVGAAVPAGVLLSDVRETLERGAETFVRMISGVEL